SGLDATNGCATSSYAANFLLFGGMTPPSGYDQRSPSMPVYNIANIPDGTSNTVMWSEVSADQTSGSNIYAVDYGTHYPSSPYIAPLFNNGLTGTPGTVWAIQFGPSGTPGSANSAQYGKVQGYHTSALVVALADGSVRSVSASVTGATSGAQ